MNGHTCPSCGKSGIICTIEDGVCENEGDCDNCIKERVYRGDYNNLCGFPDDERDGYGNQVYACRHGFPEGEECPVCEHTDGQHEEEYVGSEWLGPEYPCPMCDGYTEKEADEILKGTLYHS